MMPKIHNGKRHLNIQDLFTLLEYTIPANRVTGDHFQLYNGKNRYVQVCMHGFNNQHYTRDSSPEGIDLFTSLVQDSFVSVITFRA